MTNNQKGFGPIEALLILILLGIVGAAGWYVILAKNDTYKSFDSAAETEVKIESKTESNEQKDPTADWVAYSNKEGKFSLQYPPNWIKSSNPCSDDSIDFGPTPETNGNCSTYTSAQISLWSVKGKYSDTIIYGVGFKNVEKEILIVAGVEGERQIGIAENESERGHSDPDGTKSVRYIFHTNDRIYVAAYNQRPSYPDVLADFDLMVTKTLKFSAQ